MLGIDGVSKARGFEGVWWVLSRKSVLSRCELQYLKVSFVVKCALQKAWLYSLIPKSQQGQWRDRLSVVN
jgi:hypothetical protein